ncbi:MAG: phosphatidylserine/phosphatidylglycerophosphate/cardiolipin synthase family protein [Myxococcota bacterium]|nr:phosphatidylserine/phosphatidylglycerophosphate/cardiolipin synthase family protein [Myxococcota bacterium]
MNWSSIRKWIGGTRTAERAGFRLQQAVPSDPVGFSAALFQSVATKLEAGHQVELLDNGAVFDRLEREIGRARASVSVVMYIWEEGRASDRIVAALLERARAGVRCRLVIDAFGSADFTKVLAPRLASGGCEVRMFRPALTEARLSRNHRKVVVVDGVVAITGGFGIRDCWLGNGCEPGAWRDASVIFAGPAVQHAQQAFAENWQEAGGELLMASEFPAADHRGPTSAAFISSTASPIVTRAERLTQLVIAAATRRLWIVNAYFVPSEAILDQLAAKAAAGVDVRILVAGHQSDSKTAFGYQQVTYEALTERGVQIWEYQPCMLHSKTMVVDGRLAVVGSINLDPLSLNTLDEVALVIDDPAIAEQLEASFLADCGRAKQQP